MSEESTTADVIPRYQSQAEIFKIKQDHFEAIFDWLSLEDLVALSETCKRMQCIVGYHIKTHYDSIKFLCRSNGIYGKNEQFDEIELSGLSSYLKKLVLFYLEYTVYDYVGQEQRAQTTSFIPQMKADRFKMLTEILLKRVVFTDNGISRIKEFLGQLDTVKLKCPYFSEEFHSSFLQFCTNIKTLCIEGESNTAIVGVDNSWLLRKYPTLEHFELTTPSCSNQEISELQTFFEQNHHIKSFATHMEIILANKHIFTNTKLKLDVLSVEIYDTPTFDPSRDILNQLYECGLFKELHVYFFALHDSIFYRDVVTQLISFKGLTKLFIQGMEDGTDLSPLINVKQLCIDYASCVTNKTNLAEKLVKLEFIQFTYAGFDDISSFIRHSPKLNAIVLLRVGCYDVIPNIEKLNKERSKLANARKVSIYVEEHVYFAVKWAKNETNWSLIELKRFASYDGWNHSVGLARRNVCIRIKFVNMRQSSREERKLLIIHFVQSSI